LFKIALKILLDKVLKRKLSLLVDKKYLVYKALFPIQNIKKNFSLAYFAGKKPKMKNGHF